jgi:glycosyltransferase involved in cell wall biosynthesis
LPKLNKKVVRFMINRHDGASEYDIQIDNALGVKSNEFLYTVKDIKDYRSLPRFLALIIFWLRAQYILFFGNIDIAIVSPWMMLVYPKRVSIICISHHYDPSVFKGMRRLYVKFSHWLFVYQSTRVNVVVSCSKYWSNYYKKKGFKKTITIFNGFDIKAMDLSVAKLDESILLKRYNLQSKKYFHLGSYGPAKGQNIAIKCLKDLEFPMITTNSSDKILKDDLKNIKFINANFDEYNVLLKNSLAVICMSEFKEGWCRVLHEAAIHGTPILGSGLGGMKELLEIGGFTASSTETLSKDLSIRIKDKLIPSDKMILYRSFNLEKFYESWRQSVSEILEAR